MAKLPNTPDLKRLRELSPSLISLPRGTALHRIYRRAGGYPTLWNDFRYYGPIARFDHHRRDGKGRAHEQARGILYFALDIPTALAEVFQERRTVNRTDSQPWLVSIKLANGLSLLNLTDTFCAQAGGSMKLVSGPVVYAQNWSRALYERYEAIHGLYYPAFLTTRRGEVGERAVRTRREPLGARRRTCQYVEHGKQAQRSHGGRIACFDRRVVRNAGYPSSLTNRPAVALYERALDTGPFPDTPRFHRQLSDPLLIEPLRNACRQIGYDFL